MKTDDTPDLVLSNGRITTLDPAQPELSALAVKHGRIVAAGERAAAARGPNTRVVDLRGRRAIPGLNDSHLHVIRAGLNYHLELRWDGVPSLADALRKLKEQAQRTPPPQWVRVIGGWNEWQFAERRMPTLEELDRAAPDTPVVVLHLYDCALLNRAALRALGFDASTPNPPGGLIARDASGEPTGLLLAEPNALLLYSTIGRAPKLSFDDQLNSSRWFMRELNRFGVTSASDAGGGWQNFPDDYAVIRKLAADGELTLRIAYSLFAQKAGSELADVQRWIQMTRPGEGDDMLRVAGAGENLVWSAADFENFLQPRPDLKPVMESELEAVIRALVAARWPFRIHATYDETIGRFLSVFERVDRDISFAGLRWFFDHAETISPRNIERTRALGGGVAIQHRMAYQGEYFIRRYGRAAASACPPLQALLGAGIPVGAGTDGTRVASYHPWTCLYWLVTGKTVGGTELSAKENLLSREQALRLYTEGSAWFSGESTSKGRLAVGQLADFAVLSDDYLSCPEERIRGIESVLTVCRGNIVHAADEFAALAPALPAVSPSWSPVASYGGYANEPPARHSHAPVFGADGRLWEMGCGCAA
ncbi:MAG TPA: amidohydrolase [Myxococcota bacterium]|nr:amidohydrolase [Myxococcota bacterium]